MEFLTKKLNPQLLFKINLICPNAQNYSKIEKILSKSEHKKLFSIVARNYSTCWNKMVCCIATPVQ